MKCKKFLIGLLCLVALLFAGCSNSSFYIKAEDGKEILDVGETTSLVVYHDGDNVTRKADLKITSDQTGGSATLTKKWNKYYLTATGEGTVTIRASYETLFDEYYDSITITFIDREAELNRFSFDIYVASGGSADGFYQGETLRLAAKGSSDLFTIEQDEVQYELTKNTAGATLDGRHLTASKAGDVTVRATYTMEGRTYSDTQTYTFKDAELINNNPEFTVKVGELAQMSCRICPESLSENVDQYLTCEIVSGSGQTQKDDDGNFYITSTEVGEVKYLLKYVNGNVELSAVGTVTFVERTFDITAESTDVYVGYTTTLSATSEDIEDFNPSAENISYQVLSGDATIDFNKLVINSAGEVKVQATYLYGDIRVKSNILTLNATYDGNYIVSVEQLRNLTDSSETFNLGADLDLSDYENWEPIRNFTGTLRGHGHTISGLNITASNLESEKGLFATLAGTVENLNIDGTITANGEVQYIGLLCGKNTGTIKNVTASGAITAKYSTYVGGIAGWSDNSYITGCTNEATVWGRYTVGGVAGGINTGRSSEGKIENNSNKGAIIGEDDVGGLFGYAGGGTILVYNHKNEGVVTGSGSKVGGLIGHGKDGMTITSCTNTAEISGEDYVGGMIGCGESGVSEISFCTNSGAITGNLYVGGYAGYSTGTTMSNLTNDQIITGKAWVGGIAGYAGKMDNCTNDGALTITGVHVQSDNTKVSYVGGIAGFATSAHDCVNNSDITLNSAGNYVAGIVGYVNATRSDDATLFAKNKNHGSITSSGSYVGGVFGAFVPQHSNVNSTITINSVSNDGDITGTNNVGGIIGYAQGEYHTSGSGPTWGEYTVRIKVMASTNDAKTIGMDYVGGVVGFAGAYVSDISLCENRGDVTGNLYIGGYVGKADGTAMRNLINSNTITGKAWVGGIAGYAGELENCENFGPIIVTGYFIGDNNQALSYVGGIAGYANKAHGCTNNMDITLIKAGNYVGGIIGCLEATRTNDTTMFVGNVNHGAITSSGNYVGGIFGAFVAQHTKVSATITLNNAINDGAVSGKDYVGGIIGYAQGEYHTSGSGPTWGAYTAKINIMECSNDADVTGNDYVGGILGCGEQYMITDEVVWNTNTFTGTLTVEGENQGDKYGKIA